MKRTMCFNPFRLTMMRVFGDVLRVVIDFNKNGKVNFVNETNKRKKRTHTKQNNNNNNMCSCSQVIYLIQPRNEYYAIDCIVHYMNQTNLEWVPLVWNNKHIDE